jgi:hypothetical protein
MNEVILTGFNEQSGSHMAMSDLDQPESPHCRTCLLAGWLTACCAITLVLLASIILISHTHNLSAPSFEALAKFLFVVLLVFLSVLLATSPALALRTILPQSAAWWAGALMGALFGFAYGLIFLGSVTRTGFIFAMPFAIVGTFAGIAWWWAENRVLAWQYRKQKHNHASESKGPKR